MGGSSNSVVSPKVRNAVLQAVIQCDSMSGRDGVVVEDVSMFDEDDYDDSDAYASPTFDDLSD